MTKDQWLMLACTWAEMRWCWTDISLIADLAADIDPVRERPDAFIDRMAEKYDLDDPTEPWGSLSGPEETLARNTVKELISERWRERNQPH